MAESWQEIYERLESRDKELERRMLTLPGSQRNLKTLVKAGASEARILRLLAFAVSEKNFWQKPMRRKKREFESLANQLDTVAKHAQRVSVGPLSNGILWLAILGIGPWDDVKGSAKADPTWMLRLMRAYAKNCRGQSKSFRQVA